RILIKRAFRESCGGSSPQMATAPSPMAEARAATISPLGRVIGVFFSPKATFEDIVRKPGWLLPVGISLILGLLVSIAINQRVNWRDFMNQQIDKSPQAAQLSAEQRQQRVEAGGKGTPHSETYILDCSRVC